MLRDLAAESRARWPRRRALWMLGALGLASVAGWAVYRSDEPLHPDPSKYHCRPPSSVDPVAGAEELVRGTLRIRGHRPVHIAADVDWSLDPFDNPSWRFELHNLKYVYRLFDAAERAPSAEHSRRYIDRAEQLIRDWLRDNLSSTPPSDFSWDKHAAGLRAQVLACASRYWPAEEWLWDGLRAHGERLADPTFYAGAWNHGLDQDIGLLAIGCVSGNQSWIDVAESRIASLVSTIVDEQGATSEQAVGYHLYVWNLLAELQKTLDGCGLEVPEAVGRRGAIPLFLAHATQPDGHYVPLGDTQPWEQATAIAGTPAHHAATQGTSGVPPRERIAIYDRGYIFGRSGWGADRAFDQERFFSVRFGPGRAVHGHRDHMSVTYFARGRPILVDPGFGGYAKDAFRDFERKESAHNVVLSPDAGRFLWDAETRLTSSRLEPTWQSFVLSDGPYRGVQRRRALLVSDDPPFLIVRDTLGSAEGPRTFEQLWHLAPGSSVALEGDFATATWPEGKMTLIETTPDADLRLVEGQTDPLQGWVAVGRDERVPAPVIVSSGRGDTHEYLTVIAVTDPEDHVEAALSGSRTAGVVHIRLGGRDAWIGEATGGLLEPRAAPSP